MRFSDWLRAQPNNYQLENLPGHTKMVNILQYKGICDECQKVNAYSEEIDRHRSAEVRSTRLGTVRRGRKLIKIVHLGKL